jgi:hypothetical protein
MVEDTQSTLRTIVPFGCDNILHHHGDCSTTMQTSFRVTGDQIKKLLKDFILHMLENPRKGSPIS